MHTEQGARAQGVLPVRIAGLGYHVPPQVVTSAELEQRLGLPPGWIERVTGVRERRYAGNATSAGMAAGDLDAIICASAAPQQAIPCTAVFVQRELGAPEGRSTCFDLNATCMSFLLALQAAAALLASGAYGRILVASSEHPDRSLNFADPESAVLFGSAAAAAVLTRAEASSGSCLALSRFATHSSLAGLSELRGGGTLHHPNDPATTPETNTFHMQGLAAFKKVARLMDGFLDDFFATCPWQREEFDAVIAHQGSRHVVELLHRRFGFGEHQIISNLAVRGNCIAASIPLALAEAVHAGRIARGQKVLLLGAGAGFTLGATALRF